MAQILRHKRFYCSSGNAERTLFAPVYSDANKTVDLEKTGVINVHDAIQAAAELTDLEQLIKRFNSGDESALNKRMGFYGDATIYHGCTLRDIIENQRTVERFYNGISDDVRVANDIHSLNDFIKKSMSGSFVQKEDPAPVADPPSGGDGN